MKKEYWYLIGGAVILYYLYQNGYLGGSSTSSAGSN
jgi:hypothetical protein